MQSKTLPLSFLLSTVSAAVLVASLSLAVEPAQAAYPGANGKIAFLCDMKDDRVPEEIYVMNPDGSGVTRLTDNQYREGKPVWSPDGKKIAFERDYKDIYVVNANGTGEINVTNDPAEESGVESPTWSPDGARIAFARPDGIWIVNADGTGQEKIAEDEQSSSELAWSPDGAKIAFRKDSDIYVTNTDGTNVTKLTDDASVLEKAPSWSPDSEKIAYYSDPSRYSTVSYGRDIWVMNADGTDRTDITRNRTGSDINLVWSPDDKKILFRSENEDYGFDFYVMNPDGTEVTRLTYNGPYEQTFEEGAADWQPLVASAPPPPAQNKKHHHKKHQGRHHWWWGDLIRLGKQLPHTILVSRYQTPVQFAVIADHGRKVEDARKPERLEAVLTLFLASGTENRVR